MNGKFGSMKKQVCLAITGVLTATTMCGWAATEYWNDASAAQVTTKTQAGDHTNWEQWKTAWETLKTNFENVSIAPGADASQLNFGWYSKVPTGAAIRIATSKDMSGAVEYKAATVKGQVIDGVQYFANRATALNLKPKTTYWYQVETDGKWSAPTSVKTGDPNNFSFMYVGDPQIGASKNQKPAETGVKQDQYLAARNDAFNWNVTLNKALEQHPEINFLVSPGDQINEPAEDQSPAKIKLQETEYAGYLGAAALRNLPEAAAIGNHDSMTPGYKYHFNTPNPFLEELNPTEAGYGYYYTYGPALFIVINGNNYNAADHETLIQRAIRANPHAKWRILIMHQDIYGSGKDHSDSDGILMRTQLTPLFDKYHIDVVLQGHDHTYARTYQLSSDGKNHDSFLELKVRGQQGQLHNLLKLALNNKEYKNNYESQNRCYTIQDMKQGVVHNPKGTLFITSNSATGSKFYELIPQQQDYIAARSQTWRPTYSVMHITPHEFSVDTYDVATGQAIDKKYTIIKD